MTKAEITNAMTRHCGSAFITRKQLAQFLGYKCEKNVDRYLRGLERIGGGRFFVNDVAAQLMKDKRV